MRECWECGKPRANETKCETCGAREFVPCAIEYDESAHTEIVLADVPTVWVYGGSSHELGYDMETGALVAVRVPGLVATR